MTDPKPAPREWMIDCKDIQWQCIAGEDTNGQVHVIEYSAFSALQARCESLERVRDTFVRRNKELEAEVAQQKQTFDDALKAGHERWSHAERVRRNNNGGSL